MKKLPGFIDSHLHVLGIGYVKSNIDLTEVKSITEMIETLRLSKREGLIIGRGWNQDQFSDQRMPTKHDLNKANSNQPMVLIRVCGHIIVVNDKMLELAGINETTQQISGGSFDYETGIFTEKAIHLIYEKMPKPTKEKLKEYFLVANQLLVENGVTQVASDDFCIFDIDYKIVIEALKELYEDGLMQIKITEQVNLPMKDFQDYIDQGFVNRKIHPKFRMGPLKILADGSLGGRTAAMLEPYSDAPTETGLLTFSDEELFNLIHLADQHGMDSVVHAIGDKTSRQVIETIEKSINITKRFNHHHAIIHAQLMPEDQIYKMKELGIGAIVQPIFINTDINIVESRLGQRKNHTYLFHTMYENINLGFSTDSPIEPINPFKNIYVSMTYKSIKYPEKESLNQDQCFTLDEALKAYIKNNLPYVYESKLPEADFIIINQDIDTLSPSEIKNITVLKTVIDGVEVFSKKDK